MDIDIRKDCFGVANGLNFVYEQQLWPLIDVKMSYPDSNFSSF